ncbi:hypothetical protein GCM10020220_083120 [Nonomuraea rubra]
MSGVPAPQATDSVLEKRAPEGLGKIGRQRGQRVELSLRTSTPVKKFRFKRPEAPGQTVHAPEDMGVLGTAQLVCVVRQATKTPASSPRRGELALDCDVGTAPAAAVSAFMVLTAEPRAPLPRGLPHLTS